ncbi:hypothetical protein O1L55_40910 [Streptomyces albulus]|nr:hypothetical protein [Streptomyces noursei]
MNTQQAADAVGARMIPANTISSHTVVVDQSAGLSEPQLSDGGRRRSTPQELRRALGTMTRSHVNEGVDDYLERLLGHAGGQPLSIYEFTNIVPRLQASLWSLITDALQRTNGYPDRDLKQTVKWVCALETEASSDTFVPTDVFARRQAGLVSYLLDLTSDNDGPRAAAAEPSSTLHRRPA